MARQRERRTNPEHIGLELAALRVQLILQGNLISGLADSLYMDETQRDTLGLLQREMLEVSAWAASKGMC